MKSDEKEQGTRKQYQGRQIQQRIVYAFWDNVHFGLCILNHRGVFSTIRGRPDKSKKEEQEDGGKGRQSELG